jgi:hypothetical protein
VLQMLNKMKRDSTLALCAMLVMCAAASAASNTAARVKAFAALPDWSGLWEVAGSERTAGQGFANAKDAQRSLETLRAIHPPFRAEQEQRYQSLSKDASSLPDSSHTYLGFPVVMVSPITQFHLLVTPEQTAMLASTHDVRTIYTDGRTLPPPAELWPTPAGYSMGRWEGDTLMVETVATIREFMMGMPQADGALKIARFPMSEQLRYTERMRLVDKDTLEEQLTMIDPVALTAPWTQTVRYQRVKDGDRLIFDDVELNDRNPVINGKGTVIER